MNLKLKNSSTFYLVRHGQTEWNVKKIIQGHQDSPLTKKGIRQAQTTGKKLKDIQFDAVYSSDLLRAKRTAEIITAERSLTINTTKLLRERKLGSLEGKHFKSAQKYFKKAYELPIKDRLAANIHPEVETAQAMIYRFITFFKKAVKLHPKQNILAVSHGGMIRVLLIHLGFFAYEPSTIHSVTNASYIKLLSDGSDFVIEETQGVYKRVS